MGTLGNVLMAATALLVAGSGCALENNPLDNASTCPGSGCQEDVQAVLAEVEAVDGVVDVVQVRRSDVIGKWRKLEVHVKASPASGAEARRLGRRIIAVGEESEVQPEQTLVTIEWEPEELVWQPVGGLSGLGPVEGACADPSCEAELAALGEALEQRQPSLDVRQVALDGTTLEVSGRWREPGDTDGARDAQADIKAVALESGVAPLESLSADIEVQVPRTLVVDSAETSVG